MILSGKVEKLSYFFIIIKTNKQNKQKNNKLVFPQLNFNLFI